MYQPIPFPNQLLSKPLSKPLNEATTTKSAYNYIIKIWKSLSNIIMCSSSELDII